MELNLKCKAEKNYITIRPMMMDTFLEYFHQVMANRAVAIGVMVVAALCAIVTIAGGFYATYQIVTLLQN